MRKTSSIALTDASSPRKGDPSYAAIARETKTQIDWPSVVLSARTGPGRWQRHEAESAGDFAVYTRHESQQYAVLAVGLVSACTAEIVNLLQASSSSLYEQQMQALYEDQFKSGAIVERMELDTIPVEDGPSQLCELTVKTATFAKAGWFGDQEEWSYLDALYRDVNSGVVEKYMKTVAPTKTNNSKKALHDLLCGYLLRPGSQDNNQEEAEGTQDHSSTRVTFYAEYEMPKQVGIATSSGSNASDKVIKARLLKFAETTGRIATLVRRHRLGVQTLVDRQRFLPPTNCPCNVCTRMLTIAKLCRLCGQAVCGNCSSKHERLARNLGSNRPRVDRVRVCASCMVRVDQAEYSNLSTSSLLGPRVVPDSNNDEPAAAVLNGLLKQALTDASAPSRRHGVMNVIKALVDKDDKPVASTDDEYIDALAHFDMDIVPADQVNLRHDEERVYQMDMNVAPTELPEPPVPANNDERLNIVRSHRLSDLIEMDELSIICDLAAKEMGCHTSTINIIDESSVCVVAANHDSMRSMILPRTQSMCAHTIMDKTTAHIVPHPEADIRFNKMASVSQFGVKYYCGFPLMDEGGEVIGTMCVINSESKTITESQFASFGKLASTAQKIVRMQKRKMSMDSNKSGTSSQ